MHQYPKTVQSWIGGGAVAGSGPSQEKYAPASGVKLADVAAAGESELARALTSASDAFPLWAATPLSERALILKKAAELIKERAQEAASIIAQECGRPDAEVMGEVGGASVSGTYFTGELARFEPIPLPTSHPRRTVELVRAPVGVGALYVPFNTPLAQIAAKTFPALLCGNAVILKAHELTPYIPVWFAQVLKDAGVPDGVFNVLQGTGAGIGALIASHADVSFISFTGSSSTGARIVEASAPRLAKVSIEAGGKNPFIVCDDADLLLAVNFAVASAFVDSGQRCAAASRFLIYEGVYDTFKQAFIEKARAMRIGVGDADMGALISEERLNALLAAVQESQNRGVTIALGGKRNGDQGYFMQPTVLENVKETDPLWRQELFGPVVIFRKVSGYDEALRLAKDSPYRLSSAIHTRTLDVAKKFAREYRAGVVRINGPTFGSEPHMPFGGPGLSGNGWREPGVTALDFYANWQQVSVDS